jgi:ABC-2 type transport system permease protein
LAAVGSAIYIAPRGTRSERMAHAMRLLRVLAVVDFKTKYADSILGYFWSLLKPLSYFLVLWVVFARVFRISSPIPHFALYLILGIVLYTFTIDGVGSALTSIGRGSPIIRRLSFPRIAIPISATVTALITFGVNLTAVVVFMAGARVTPDMTWFAIPLLFVELYAFVVGLGLLIAALFVRFRDIAQIWELIAQLLIFATPVMYPITILPHWAQVVEYCNPLVQVMQDLRAVVVGTTSNGETVSSVVWGSGGRLIPIGVTLGVLVLGVVLFQRDAPRLAELV